MFSSNTYLKNLPVQKNDKVFSFRFYSLWSNWTSYKYLQWSFAVIGWNVCKRTKFFSCFCLLMSKNNGRKPNGLDFMLMLHCFPKDFFRSYMNASLKSLSTHWRVKNTLMVQRDHQCAQVSKVKPHSVKVISLWRSQL